jgi:hypothetical protein
MTTRDNWGVLRGSLLGLNIVVEIDMLYITPLMLSIGRTDAIDMLHAVLHDWYLQEEGRKSKCVLKHRSDWVDVGSYWLYL